MVKKKKTLVEALSDPKFQKELKESLENITEEMSKRDREVFERMMAEEYCPKKRNRTQYGSSAIGRQAMAREKPSKKKELAAEENLRLWEKAMKDYKPNPLTLEEKMVIDRMRFAHEQSQKIPFILGEEVKAVGVGATR